jgi:4-amino-4-deoxy-L-arabinose transferase-like glycosyltransferase
VTTRSFRTASGHLVRPPLAHVLLLVALCLAVNLHGIAWGLPNGEYDWAPDSVAPRGPLLYGKQLLSQEPWTSKYPPVHFMVLSLVYAPYVAYLRVTGGLGAPTSVYPFGLADAEFSLMVFTLTARLVSALMGVAMVLVNYHAVGRLWGRRAGLVAAFLIGTSYPIVHYAHNANLDVPHMFWASLALWSLVAVAHGGGRAHSVLLAVFSALAVGTKNSAYALVVGFGLVAFAVLCHRHRRAAREDERSRVRGDLAWGLVAFAVALVLAFNVPVNWQGFWGHVQSHLGRSVKGARILQQASSGISGELALLRTYGAFVFEANVAPVFALLVAGVAYGLWRVPRQTLLVLVPAVTYYVLFLRVHPTSHIRYVLPLYLLLSWPAGKLAADLLAGSRRVRLAAAAVFSVVGAYAVLQAFTVGSLYNGDARYALEAWLRRSVAPGTMVVGIGPDYSLPRFPPEIRVIRRHVWNYNGGEIGTIDDIDPEYLVLGLSVPQRVAQGDRLERFLGNRGYRLAAEFKSPLPLFGREIEDLASLNPRVAVFRRMGGAAGPRTASPEPGRSVTASVKDRAP